MKSCWFRLALLGVFFLAAGCEEIAYVTVVAPRGLAGARVMVRGEEWTRLSFVREDGRVESKEPLPFPPTSNEFTIEKRGCASIHVRIQSDIGERTYEVSPHVVRCATTRALARPREDKLYFAISLGDLVSHVQESRDSIDRPTHL